MIRRFGRRVKGRHSRKVTAPGGRAPPFLRAATGDGHIPVAVSDDMKVQFPSMNDCIFCKIIKGDVTAKLVYSSEKVVAFEDINPQAPTHYLIVPTEHIPDTLKLTEKDAPLLGEIFAAANSIARDLGVDATGFRLVNNCGAHGGQTVGHLHFHLMGGRPMTWPPG